MDWKDAASTVAQYAPAVATALGGPAAGGITAGAARMVTGLLGIENTPESLVNALEDPSKLAELKRIDNDHKLELEKLRMQAEAAQAAEETARLQAVNKTIQAEIASNDGYVRRWRPTYGYLIAITWFIQMTGFVVILGMVAYFAPGDLASVVGALGTVLSALMPLWGIALAVVGVNINKRSQDKQVAAGQQPAGGFMNAIAATVQRK